MKVEETVGFEPTDRLPHPFLSKEVLSATQPRLHSVAVYMAEAFEHQALFSLYLKLT